MVNKIPDWQSASAERYNRPTHDIIAYNQGDAFKERTKTVKNRQIFSTLAAITARYTAKPRKEGCKMSQGYRVRPADASLR